MKYHTGLDSKKKYLAGVSGGCDSMMLLSLCIREHLDVVVAMVNYHIRETADYEQQLVEEYCRDNGIKCEVLYAEEHSSGNFQQWAREQRFQFYRRVYEENSCDALVLGHQLDDHLENYLMSLQRNSHGWFYGIRYENCHHGMRILRPLLKLRKKEIRQYCLDNDIPFHDDESNYSD